MGDERANGYLRIRFAGGGEQYDTPMLRFLNGARAGSIRQQARKKFKICFCTTNELLRLLTLSVRLIQTERFDEDSLYVQADIYLYLQLFNVNIRTSVFKYVYSSSV